MKRTLVAREVADALHATEASLDATLASSRSTLERMTAAKAELGLTGTVGDAALARVRETVAALEEAQALLIEAHQEAYTVVKAIDLRSRMGIVETYRTLTVEDDTRAA